MSAFIISNKTILPIPPKICSLKLIKIFLDGFPFRLGVMILHLTSQLQIIVFLSLLYLCRLSEDLPRMVSCWQHFATVWKVQFECYEGEIPSPKLWINSGVSMQLFKSTEAISITPRLTSLFFVCINFLLPQLLTVFLLLLTCLQHRFCFPNIPFRELTFVTDVTFKNFPLHLLLLVFESVRKAHLNKL